MKFLVVLFAVAAVALATTEDQDQTADQSKLARYRPHVYYAARPYHGYPRHYYTYRHRRSTDVQTADQDTEEWRHKHFNYYYRPAYGYRGYYGYRWKRSAEPDTQDQETEEVRRKYYGHYPRYYQQYPYRYVSYPRYYNNYYW